MTRPALVFIALGAIAAVAVLVRFVLWWEIFAPGEPPPFQIAGCDLAELHETPKHDAGVMWRDYDLTCFVNATSPAPTCDDVIARYVASQGPLPKVVNVVVRNGQPRAPEICHRQYRGDGTPVL